MSGTDARAVRDTGTVERILIAHWNGKTWSRVRSPNSGGVNELLGVAASSPTRVWAVGLYTSLRTDSTCAVHCC